MNVNLVNPLVLAYIGDAIYELKIRSMLVYSKINNHIIKYKQNIYNNSKHFLCIKYKLII